MSSSFPFTSTTLIIIFLFSSISPFQAKSSNHNLLISTPTIAAAPAVLPESPSYQELSPEITPLLPFPSGGGGRVEPTIPSSLSPPNPDDAMIGPDSAYAPDGSLQESGAPRCLNFVGYVCNVGLLFGMFCFWVFHLLTY